MHKRKENGFYILEDYFRQEIDLDTAFDARHLVSVLVSLCPDLNCVFLDHKVECKNLCNHMRQHITITWKHQV